MSSDFNPFDYMYKPTWQEYAVVIAVPVTLVGLFYTFKYLFSIYKQRKLLTMCLDSPEQLYLLISGRSVASDQEFAIEVKKEVDFSAKWFKDRTKEECDPHKV